MDTATSPRHAPTAGRPAPASPRSTGTRTVAAAGLGILLLASCAAPGGGSDSGPAPEPVTGTHGYVEGAEEIAEPRLSLALADRQGALALVDLLDGTVTALPGPGGPVDAMAGDGRFVYPVRIADGRSTVEIVDGGRWTVEHGDHFHYYLGATRAVGTVTGTGLPTIHSGDRKTAIAFPASGEVVVLGQDDLAAGTLGDPRTVTRTGHPGMLAVPYAGHLLVTTPGPAGTAAGVEVLDEQGRPVDGSGTPCPDASDATITRAGVVVPCSDGAVLVAAPDGAPTAEKIPYPAGVASAAGSLDGRIGRPVVAGPTDPATGTGPAGYWQLDTRRREWTFRPTDVRLVAATAVGDTAGRVVAVDDAGRVLVFGADGANLGSSDPLLAASTADPATRDRVRLFVDANRAYVSGPADAVVLEVDYRDGARIARTFYGLDPQFFEQVG